jgi:tetratricopeptide (TPR) repeat protein
LRPDNEDAYFSRGLIFLDVGAFDRAVADFTRAHELDPEDHWNLANRGITYAWMNDRARAEEDFAKVAAADPANPLPTIGAAVLALQAGDQKTAIAHLTKALERDPLDGWALRMRAHTYWDMGLHNLAREDDDRFNRLEESWEKSQLRAK